MSLTLWEASAVDQIGRKERFVVDTLCNGDKSFPSKETWKYIEQTASAEENIRLNLPFWVTRKWHFLFHIGTLKICKYYVVWKEDWEWQALSVLKVFFLPFFSSCWWKFEVGTLNVNIFFQRFHSRRLINCASLFTR